MMLFVLVLHPRYENESVGIKSSRGGRQNIILTVNSRQDWLRWLSLTLIQQNDGIWTFLRLNKPTAIPRKIAVEKMVKLDEAE